LFQPNIFFNHIIFPNIIDGKQSELYRNRKCRFSFNEQVVINARLEVIDIVARWPGSSHDSTIFNHSRIKSLFEADTVGDSVLVADSGYPNLSDVSCFPFILK